MLNKFLDDYEQIILICAKKNYTKKQTEEVLSALELYRYKKYQQAPRAKELNYVIKAIYKTKSDENEEDDFNDSDKSSGSYLWISESGGCSACRELDGQVFDEEPERPHPNCKCEIKEIDGKEADDRKEKHKENKDKRDKVVEDLNEQAKFDKDGNPKLEDKSTGYCAKYVANALDKNGINIKQYQDIKNDPDYDQAYRYGEYLEKEKFETIESYKHQDEDRYSLPKGYVQKKGDIAVFDKTEKHPSGHMAMYNGTEWVSDFKQRDMWGGGIRNENPSYAIYRNPNWQDWERDN